MYTTNKWQNTWYKTLLKNFMKLHALLMNHTYFTWTTAGISLFLKGLELDILI